ncbi:MAG: histidine phosphatase family protein [Saprospiraceae bacterium]|nr:histidine phosphatase family protein [Saprospiraceae bacterium]
MKSWVLSIPILGSIFLITLFSPSCKKEPEIIIQTVTDTLTLIQHDTVTIIEVDSIFQTINDTVTTFIMVRHAETTGTGSNPVLSAAGVARANELRAILENVSLGAVFATNFNRTMQTAEPTATAQALTLQTYDPFNLDVLVDDALLDFPGGAVLVVGHSNTNASLLNLLTGTSDYPDFPEDVYNDLFIISVLEKGRANVAHLKYGD